MGFIDEAEFTKVDTLRNIYPMLLQNACLVLASTPPIHESPCKNIKEGVTTSGDRICDVYNLEMTCGPCKKLQEQNSSILCEHNIGMRPTMHDPEVIEILQAAYGNAESFEREINGVNTLATNRFIPRDNIETLVSSEWYDFKVAPRFVFVSIDPATNVRSENNIRSFFALVTSCIVDGMVVVYPYILVVFIYF